MRKTILTIEDGQCRFPVTDAPPHLFCGEVTALDRVYCDHHHAICNTGFGKNVGDLESMIYSMEKTVARRRPSEEGSNTAAVDTVIK